MQTLQIEMESKDITIELLEKEIKDQKSTYQSFRKEEEYRRFKSRSLWLKARDRTPPSSTDNIERYCQGTIYQKSKQQRAMFAKDLTKSKMPPKTTLGIYTEKKITTTKRKPLTSSLTSLLSSALKKTQLYVGQLLRRKS